MGVGALADEVVCWRFLWARVSTSVGCWVLSRVILSWASPHVCCVYFSPCFLRNAGTNIVRLATNPVVPEGGEREFEKKKETFPRGLREKNPAVCAACSLLLSKLFFLFRPPPEP